MKISVSEEARGLSDQSSHAGPEWKFAQHSGKYDTPKSIGKLFHDFRRSAAHEAWKAGNSMEECKEITGHKTDSMFKRYADLFSDEEKRERQRVGQSKRREYRKAQAENVITMPKRAAVQ